MEGNMKKSPYFMMIALLSLLVAAGAAFAGSKGSGGDGEFAGDYAMGGSTTVEPIIVTAIEAFATKYPAAVVLLDLASEIYPDHLL